MNQRANRKKVMKTEEKIQLLQSELTSCKRTLDSYIYGKSHCVLIAAS